jgi:hypothetical protein
LDWHTRLLLSEPSELEAMTFSPLLWIMMWALVMGVDIDCNNLTSPLVLNVTAAPSVRILNCSRRIAVTVPCGEDEERQMTVEVVGGTTVPEFTFRLCVVDGVEGGFAYVMLLLNGVVMQQNNISRGTSMPKQQSGGAIDAVNPLPGTLLPFGPMSALASVAIQVVDSTLLWVTAPTKSGGQLVHSYGADLLRNVNVTVDRSTLVVWSVGASPQLMDFESARSQMIRVTIAHSVVAMTMSDNGGFWRCVVQFVCSAATDVHIDVSHSFVSITGNEGGSAYFISRVAPPASATGRFSYIFQTVSDTNVTAVIGSSFYVVAAPFITTIFTHSSFAVRRCIADVNLIMVDRSLLSECAVFIVLTGATVNMNVSLEVFNVQAHVVKNMVNLSKPPPGYASFSLGTIGLVNSVNANISQSSTLIKDSIITIEEVGPHVVAPFAPAAFLGVGVVTVTYSLYFAGAALLSSCSVVMVNSSIHVQRAASDDASGVIYVSPLVQSGLVIWTVSAAAFVGPIVQSNITVQSTSVTASTAIYPSDATRSVAVWCVITAVASVSPSAFFSVDLPQLAQFATSFSSSGFSSLDMNRSSVDIFDVTMMFTPPLLSQLAAAERIDSMRVVFGLAVIVSVFNTSITIHSSGASNLSASLTALETQSSVCASLLMLAPTGHVDGLEVVVNRVDLVVPSALLCSCGSTLLRNAFFAVRDSRLVGPARERTVDRWDVMRLAPTSSAFRTTVLVDNATVLLHDTSFTSFRSLFGNITTTPRLTAANNAAVAVSPLLVTLSSCASNVWDDAPLVKHGDQLAWPVEGTRRVNSSLVAMTVSAGSQWCLMSRSATQTPFRVNATGTSSYANVVAVAHSTSIATLAVGLASMAASAVGPSTLPRLQGIVGTLRLAARCQAVQSSVDLDRSDDGAPGSSVGLVASDISDNPLLFDLVPVSATLAFAVGALVGNTLLVVVVGVLSHALHAARRRALQAITEERSVVCIRHPKPDRNSSEDQISIAGVFLLISNILPTTPLPVSVMVLHGLLQEPTIGAAVASIVSNERGVASVVIAVLVGTAWVAVPCIFMWLLCVKHLPLPLVAVATRRVGRKQLRWARVGRALEWLCAAREEWVASQQGRAGTAAARAVKERLGALFEGYRGNRHWYFGVDALLSAVTGVITGAAQSVASEDACDAAVWGTACVGALATVSAMLCLVLRPFTVRCELAAAVGVSLLALLSEALILAGEVNASGVVALLAAATTFLSVAAGYAWIACQQGALVRHRISPNNNTSVAGLRSDGVRERGINPVKKQKNGRATGSSDLDPPLLFLKQEETLKELIESICGNHRAT